MKLTVIFSAKKFFTENRVFSIFAKKLEKKFVFFEKKRVSLKREKMRQIFRRQVRGNRTEISAGKFFLKKTKKKKIVIRGISGGFLRKFRKFAFSPR